VLGKEAQWRGLEEQEQEQEPMFELRARARAQTHTRTRTRTQEAEMAVEEEDVGSVQRRWSGFPVGLSRYTFCPKPKA